MWTLPLGRVIEVRAKRDGTLAAMDGRAVGLLAMDPGAGTGLRRSTWAWASGCRPGWARKVVKGDHLFQVYAKANQSIMPNLYLSTLRFIRASTL